MNVMKVTAEIYKMSKSSLQALLHTGHTDISSQVNRNKNCIGPWMISALVLCIALIAAGFTATAAPAQAADPLPKIDISPVEGIVGSTILVRASYCVKNTSVWVTFTPPSGVTGSTFTVTIKTDDNGFGSAELTVGLTPAGNYQISATDGGTVTPTPNIKFFIVNPSVTLSQSGGLVGDTVEVWGNGFTPKKPIVILLDDVKVTTSETDDTGAFPNAKFVFPPSASGKHAILVKDYVTKPVTATYTINPRIMLNPVSGCVGDTIQISGAGFPAVANVILSFEGADIATVPTDARGSVLTTFKIPPCGDALHKIKLTDGLNPVISNITVVPAMTINQNTGYVGQSVTLNGSGFRSGNALLGTYDTINLSGSTVGQDGSFAYTFKIPKSTAGPHNINITDGVNNRSAAFTMESTPPPAPGLAAPSEGARFTKDARFVWETVTDPSGVTYTIEIADDTRFTQPVISQANLVQTYLDVPDSAKTLPGKSDGYYWRVKATDGASNVGPWSVIGSFYKGVTVESVMSDMPAWTKFALVGVGLILFVFMVIFIRRNIMRVRYSDEEEADEYSDDEYGGELEAGNKSKGYLN
jgi:hypothetical protein